MEHFKYNQKIRAYDYKPSEGFEKFIEGAVIYSGMIKHPKYNIDMYEGYIIQVTNADDENDPRIGDIAYVPFKSSFDWEDRITKI